MSPKKKQTKAPAVPAPQNLREAEALVGEIGRLQREVDRIEAAMNDELAAVRGRYEKDAAIHNALIEEKFAAVQAWAESRKSELLPGKARTAKLATGEISWRLTPPAVKVSGADKVLAALKKLGLTRFIRTKEEIDKEAILADPESVEGVKGLSITQREEFVVKPFETEIERVSSKKAA